MEWSGVEWNGVEWRFEGVVVAELMATVHDQSEMMNGYRYE